MIMAGGTGGHVFPGLAVARRLRAQQVPVMWLGTREGLEARVVPAAAPDIDMEWITIRSVRGGGVLRWLALPWRMARAMAQAFAVLRRRRPQVVLSMGGFVAGPGGLVAWLTRTPLLIHEQNAIPGMTNKWLALFARQVLTGFPITFGNHKRVRHVGNPVRAEIARLPDPTARFIGRQGALRLLVVGGSLGATALNQVVPQALRALNATARPEVWHQCGRDSVVKVEQAYGDVPAKVLSFIDDMAAAYAWADVVLCRAGAMTVAELAAAGLGAILVPYPHAVDDHQTANARFLVDRGAAVLVQQRELMAERLVELLQTFSADRQALLKMAQAARACSLPTADDTVAQLCLEVCHA
ncbi:MAG: undecaprenyldiphospho-muramoylpentapeptide beta-N-acetylglucosaminyltransferase [Gammaproteobacteria bacterium]|nr:undecaprenyldiphospho-muramoylpentapeptide beta-N-acetylglucosaminyltransferase [Gammaproteobacteria bacterium]